MDVLGLIWIPNWFLIVLIVVVTYVVYMSKEHYIFKSMGVKGPAPFPVFGNFFTLWKKGFQGSDRDWMKKYGHVYGIYEGKCPVLTVADTSMLKEILVKKFHCFTNRRPLFGDQEPPLDSMLTLLEGDQWKHVRNALTPAFSGGKLKKMMSLIDSACEKLVDKLERSAERKEEVEIKIACGGYTMDVIASTAFGIQIDSQTNPDDPFVIHAKNFFDIKPYMIIMSVFFRFLIPIFNKIGLPIIKRSNWEFFASVTAQAIEQRKSDTDRTERKDFLQLMIEAAKEAETFASQTCTANGVDAVDTTWHRKGLTFNEILGQAIIFFSAGYETTASTLSLVFYNLALNPNVTEKALQEIDEVVGKGDVSYDQIGEMHYLDKIILETQRKYPAAVRFDRVCNEATEVGGINIPKGMVIAVPVGAIHHNPEYWPEPEKFDPERFSTKKKSDRNPFHYMPFGYGPRNCIGMRLALLEMKMAAVRVLQKLRPVKVEKTVENPELSKLGFLQVKGGVWIGFEKRESQ